MPLGFFASDFRDFFVKIRDFSRFFAKVLLEKIVVLLYKAFYNFYNFDVFWSLKTAF